MKKFAARVGLGPILALTIAALMLLLTIVILQVIGKHATRQVEADIGSSLEELAYQTTDKLDRGMFERYREIQLIAAREEFADPKVPLDVKRAQLELLQRSYPQYAWIGITDKQGIVKASTRKMLEGLDVSARPWFANAFRNIHLTDVHEAVLLAKLLPNPSGEPLRFFDVAFPYRDRTGAAVGVLGVHLSWQWASDIEKSVLRPLARRNGVDTLIVSQQGSVLLGPDEFKGVRLNQRSFQRAQTEKIGHVVETWPNGKRYLVGFSKSQGHLSYPGFGWTVLVRQELDAAYRPVHDLQEKILRGGMIAAIVFALLALVLATHITRPLRLIARSAQRVESGEASDIELPPGHFAEVNMLAGSLQTLLRKLAANQQNLRDLNAALEYRVEERTKDLALALDDYKTSERRIRAIIDSALDAYVETDRDGNITDWNPQAEVVFGWSRHEVLGKSLAAIMIPSTYRAAHEKGMQRFMQSGKANVLGKRLQLSALRSNGEEFPIEMTIAQINANETVFFGAFIQDISVRRNAERALEKQHELLNTVLDAIDVGVVACDPDGRLSLFNRATQIFHGLPMQETLPPEEWSKHYQLFHADGKTPMQAHEIPLVRALSGEAVHNAEMVICSRSGQVRSLEASGRSMSTPSGEKLGAVVVMKDITERKRTEQELRQSQLRLATLADNMPVTILYIDREERYRFSNKTYEAWFERPAHSIYGKTVDEVFTEQGYPPDVYRAVQPLIRSALNGHRVTAELQHMIHGELRHIEATYIPDWDTTGQVVGFYSMMHDINERKKQELHFEHHALHDTLTDLPNRRACMDRLQQAMVRAERRKTPLAVFFLDLDKFKHINDTYGHDIGDKVLIAFAKRLQKCVRKSDTVARLAGDEFVILAEEIAQVEGACTIARKIIAALEEPLVPELPCSATTSIGIALYERGVESAASLLNRADQAMYRAKQQAPNSWCVWSE